MGDANWNVELKIYRDSSDGIDEWRWYGDPKGYPYQSPEELLNDLHDNLNLLLKCINDYMQEKESCLLPKCKVIELNSRKRKNKNDK